MPGSHEVLLNGEFTPSITTRVLLTLSGVEAGPTLVLATLRVKQHGPGLTNASATLWSNRTGQLDAADTVLLVAGPVVAAPATSFASPTQSVGPYPLGADCFASFHLVAMIDAAAGDEFALGLGFGQAAPPSMPPSWLPGATLPPEPLPTFSVQGAAIRAIPVAAITSSGVEPTITGAASGSAPAPASSTPSGGFDAQVLRAAEVLRVAELLRASEVVRVADVLRAAESQVIAKQSSVPDSVKAADKEVPGPEKQ